jgi:hypothetical protein
LAFLIVGFFASSSAFLFFSSSAFFFFNSSAFLFSIFSALPRIMLWKADSVSVTSAVIALLAINLDSMFCTV